MRNSRHFMLWRRRGSKVSSNKERRVDQARRTHRTSFRTPCFFSTFITVSRPPASSKIRVLVGESAKAQKSVSRRLEASGVGGEEEELVASG
jgi:hypothetical protein